MKRANRWALWTWIGVGVLYLAGPIAWANPYAEVDWETWEQHRANLHTHTRKSDGGMFPAEAIDHYHQRGYTVLSLTDHDTWGEGADAEAPDRAVTTWPWQRFGRDPAELGMVAIEGNEISRVHHMGSYFSDYGDAEVESPEHALTEIGRRGGLAVMFHPGRYEQPVEWYVELFTRFEHLLGLEVFNQGNRFPWDMALWDEILSSTMPERRVWGFSNDDMHGMRALGRNWQVLLVPELTERNVRRAMESGRFYFCRVFEPGQAAPVIKSIEADKKTGVITIQAEGCQEILWISCGRVVLSGPTFDPEHARQHDRYVRAMLRGPHGDTYTQPFRLTDRVAP